MRDITVGDIEVYYQPGPMWEAPNNPCAGWYWRAREGGVLLDPDPVGPFVTEGEAWRDAREALG